MRRQLRGAPSHITSTCPPVKNVASMLLLAYMHTHVTKLVLICQEISFKGFLGFFYAIFGTKLNVKKKTLHLERSRRNIQKNQTLPLPDFPARLQRNPTDPSSGRQRYSKRQQPGCKVPPHPTPKQKHISDSEHLCFSDYFLPSHVSLRPATPQQDTGGNSGGKVNIQSLVWQ